MHARLAYSSAFVISLLVLPHAHLVNCKHACQMTEN